VVEGNIFTRWIVVFVFRRIGSRSRSRSRIGNIIQPVVNRPVVVVVPRPVVIPVVIVPVVVTAA
jgi:hypothetical protein